MRYTIGSAVLTLLVAACASAPEPLPHAARPVVERARWEAWSGGTLVGYVRQLEIQDPTGPLTFYRIEDLQGRWLGHATAQGRFSRRVPFREEEDDLGVWSLPRGVAELVDAKAPVQLKPTATEADAKKQQR